MARKNAIQDCVHEREGAGKGRDSVPNRPVRPSLGEDGTDYRP